MNQNRSAAGLRKSAIAERIRLREEWSALKGYDAKFNQQKEPRFVTKKIKSQSKHKSSSTQPSRFLRPVNSMKNIAQHISVTSEVLRGIVALVDVGTESRALPLRAALTALGATVVPSWNPLVTHLIWSQGGSRETRAQARALATRLVSPLWVEGCAASGSRLPEHAFPAPTRASDLPSPKTLRQLLKKYDMENIPLNGLLSDSEEKRNTKQLRLRWSSDTSADKTTDKSRDKSTDKTAIEARVNTVLRRAVQLQSTTEPQKKSRRKLFTQKEVASDSSGDDETMNSKPSRRQKNISELKLTQRERRDLAQAERIARRMFAACTARTEPTPLITNLRTPRIILTGMNQSERGTVKEAIRALGGRLQRRINRKTTHVLLGSCLSTATVGNQTPHFTGLTGSHTKQSNLSAFKNTPQKPRTVNALEGAARGCRVLRSAWATDSCLQGRWIHDAGYEVHHLKKISQKARFERIALGLRHSEYIYDVFHGLHVLLTPDAEQRNSAKHLLELCGAVITDNQERGDVTTQNGRHERNIEKRTDDPGVTVGVRPGEVSSKWVFDSVAAGRPRTTRRYVNVVTDIDKWMSSIDKQTVVR